MNQQRNHAESTKGGENFEIFGSVYRMGHIQRFSGFFSLKNFSPLIVG